MRKIAQHINALYGKASWWMFDPITVSVARRSATKFKTENRRRMLKRKQTEDRYPVVTEKTLRRQIHPKSTSRLSKAIIKVGRQVNLDSDTFETWLEELTA